MGEGVNGGIFPFLCFGEGTYEGWSARPRLAHVHVLAPLSFLHSRTATESPMWGCGKRV